MDVCPLIRASLLPGNAWTDATIDNGGAVDFWYSHALVSRATRDNIHRYCKLGEVGPLRAPLTANGGLIACAPISTHTLFKFYYIKHSLSKLYYSEHSLSNFCFIDSAT